MAQRLLGHKNAFQSCQGPNKQKLLSPELSRSLHKMSRNPNSLPGKVSLCGNNLHGYNRGIKKPHWVRVYTYLMCLLPL